MPLDRQRCRPLLREFRLRDLFVEELGWDRHSQSLDVTVDGTVYQLSAIAQKGGLVAFECPDCEDLVRSYPGRRKVETQVAKSVREHLIVYTDPARTTQIWQWVKREIGRPAACREHIYRHAQPGDSLLQKLEYLAFTLEDEERGVTVVDSHGRVRQGFDVERVTRRFYDRFKAEHAAFLKFVKGIPEEGMQRWYVSVTLNRLMFIYFIQKKGFLDDDGDYLRHKLEESGRRGRDHFYRDFLGPLFFDGFAKRECDRTTETNQLLGRVPYLNGGIFLRHEIERQHGDDIAIPDTAFERIFDFFDAYQWHLDERPLRRDDEINPDVLGYIFEKYINQKQMGAYYTKEDITGYISQSTVIPYLFDVARQECRIAFEGESSVWRLLRDNPDRYLYSAVRSGVIDEHGQVIPESVLPDFVQVGTHDPKARMFDRRYNLGAAEVLDAEGNNLALPTETWREYVVRRQRCLELRGKLRAGEMAEINDLITYNLDIRQFAQDVIEECEGPELLRAFWHAIESVTVLDPTCGSGAFLFAALNILEPLYEACLQRMEAFVEDLERSGEKRSPRKFEDFRKVLARMEQHPNHRYFILKTIIINNLFGVDIMEEAVEICKLRLFLKLVAQIESLEHLEPLPDIDFNIRAGNTLVGYARLEDIRRGQRTLDFEDVLAQVDQRAEDVDRLFFRFRQQQTEFGGEVTASDKDALRTALSPLEDELNRYLAGEYGVDLRRKKAYEDWRKSHKPFHWFIEFHGIMKRGGFDAIIGNPPYVEYRTISGAYNVPAHLRDLGNLQAMISLRALELLQPSGWFSFVVPVALPSTDRMKPVRQCLQRDSTVWTCHFDFRPSKLFEGSEQRLTIFINRRSCGISLYTTKYNRWYSEERPDLFSTLECGRAADSPALRDVWSKTGGNPSGAILNRVLGRDKQVGAVAGRGSHHLYYKNTGVLYFTTFTRKAPECFIDGVRASSSRETRLAFRSEGTRQVMHCLLNSTLFYFLYQVHSNCRDLNPSDIATMRFPPSLLGDPSLLRLSDALHESQQNTSHFIVRRQRLTGEVRIQAFFPTRSKPIIDQIDQVLAKHYGFTDEELDFIINYDIKYRMGRDGGGGDDDHRDDGGDSGSGDYQATGSASRTRPGRQQPRRPTREVTRP